MIQSRREPRGDKQWYVQLSNLNLSILCFTTNIVVIAVIEKLKYYRIAVQLCTIITSYHNTRKQ